MKFIWLVVVALSGALFAQVPTPPLGFESAVPPSWSAESGSLSPSTERFKSGRQSLSWSWSGTEASLTLHDPALAAKRGPKSGFALWVYNENPRPEALVVEALSQDKVLGSAWFWMDFSGWRILGCGYGQLGLATDQLIDVIRFRTPEGNMKGRLFLDDACLGFDYTASQTPQTPWVGITDGLQHPGKVRLSTDDPALNRPWLPKRPQHATAEEKADIAKLTQAFLQTRGAPGKGIPPDQLKILRETFAAYQITRNGKAITGRPIDGGTALKPEGHISYGDYLKTCQSVKNAFYQAKDAAETDELRRMFIDLTAHLIDQGWAQGIRLGAWDNYPIAASSCFYGMRDVLIETGLARPVAQALMDNFGSHGPGDFAKEHPSSSMDGLGFWHRELIACALMFPTTEEQVQHLRIAQRFLNLAITEPNTIAPDGCTYHHGGFHYAYASYNLPRLVQVLRQTQGTGFRVDARAHERLRTYVRSLAHTFSHGEQAYNLGMRAGTPMNSGGVSTVARELALMGTPDGKEPLDREMAALALWLMTDERGNQPHPDFAKEPVKTWIAGGIKSTPPSGHVTLNGAPIAVHRRDGWLASIAGISTFWRGLEIYGWTQQNNYARFARHGSLVITSNGTPPDLKNSGWAYEGWNWCHFPGTTALRQSPREIFDGYAMYGNSSPLAGGTSLDQDGIWGMVFQGTGTRFQKSYFCFGNRITALTTGIVAERKEQPKPVVTTIYQNAISPGTEFVTLDGEPIKTFPHQQTVTFDKDHCLIDNKGTGYLIPAGNDPLKLSSQSQEWLYMIDKYLVDPKQNPISKPVTYQNIRGHIKDLAAIEKSYRPTRGDFALAWFDHGSQPKSAACSYTLVIKTTPEEMRKLAAKPGHRILCFGDKIHAVQDLQSNTYGYAIYQPDARLPADGPLRSSSEPCFLMIRLDGGKLHCSLAYTKLKNVDPYPDVGITLTLDGQWAAPDARGIEAGHDGGTTTLVIRPRDNTPLRWTLQAD
jgi:chondroitin-sulfate-ABC endolyase/exolyase